MSITDDDVRTALHRATDHLSGPPGLLDDVRRGGQRRVVRRRAVLGAGLAVAAAASAGGVLRLSGTGNRVEAASPLFDQPTRGDLAGDAAYLRRVREQWEGLRDPLPNMRGAPHVFWAGTTPAGPAAFVAQRGGTGAAVAFVEPTGDGPRIVAVEPVNDLTSLEGISQAVLLGPERDVLLVIDFGWPVELSTSLRYGPDAKVVREYHTVVFEDGAAWRRVGRQLGKITVALRPARSDPRSSLFIANATTVLYPTGESRGAAERREHYLPGAELVWGDDMRGGKATLSIGLDGSLVEYEDPAGFHAFDADRPVLWIYGGTPDGRRLWVQTIQYDDDPTRAVAMLGRHPDPLMAVGGAFVDWNAALPMQLRLPDGQGTVVAAPDATLDYRVEGDSRWRRAGQTAALLPRTATEVRVTPAHGAAQVVRL